MTAERYGWFVTASGRRAFVEDPRACDLVIEDIAHALSNICRFGGHCSRFYSVAQHSVCVSALVERTRPDLALHALLHDAAEAYVGDVIRPIKPTLRVRRFSSPPLTFVGAEQFVDAERRVEAAILDAFDLTCSLRPRCAT